MKNVSKIQFANSLFWKLCNFISSKGLTIFISIILARLLDPSHFGLAAIWSVMLSFCNVIVTGGMDTVLVQRNDLNNEDWSMVLVACLCRAGGLFFLSVISAPYIALFYNMPLLNVLIKIAGFDYFCQAIISIITAKKIRNMDFKVIFYADFFSTLFGGCFAVYIYYSGFTELVLVANTISHRVAYSLLLCLNDGFSVNIAFNFKRYKLLFQYGHKVMLNGLIDLCSSNIKALVIGKKWTPTEIGYLERAEKYTQTIGIESYNVISDLLLPTFSSYQENMEQLKIVGRNVIASSCYIMFPLMFGLAVCSKELVVLLLTEKWIQIVPLMQILCITYALNPIRQACGKINYAIGKYRINVIIEIVRLILTIISLIIIIIIKSPPISIICITSSLIIVITTFLYLFSMRNAMKYTFLELVRDIGPTVILVLISMLPVYLLKMLDLSLLLYLILSTMTAVFVYLSFSAIFEVKVFCYIFSSLMELIKKRKSDIDKHEY